MVLNFSIGSDWELVIFCWIPDWKHSSHFATDELAQPLLSLQLRSGRTQQIFVRCSSPAAFRAAPENWQKRDSTIENLHHSPFRYPGTSSYLWTDTLSPGIGKCHQL